MDATEFWNEQYSKEPLLFGNKPSVVGTKTIQEMNKKELKTVLDVGCAHGRDSTYLAKNGFEVTGIDISKIAIETSNQLSDKMQVNAKYIVGDFFSHPFKTKFDCIINFNTLHLFFEEKRKEFIQRMHDLLNENGIIVVASFSNFESQYGKGENSGEEGTFITKGKPVHFFTEAEIKNLLKDKFKLVSNELVEVTEEHGGIHKHKLFLFVAEKK